MKDYEKCTDIELKTMAEAIESSCRHYKNSHDGSYEMALNDRGYYDIETEILARKEGLKDSL